jgi:aldose 1-epimerase
MGQIGRSEFGRAGDQTAHLFTLRNSGGMVAKITDYGTILTELHVPGREGKTADVVLGFDALEEYLKGHPFFGAIAGRVANRIAGGRFTLDGKEYALAVNNGPNHLHGGIRGFDKYVWEAEASDTPEGPSLRMTRTSPAGEEGYPGALRATVAYTLTERNELRIEMAAVTDAPTIVNLAHHTYWNLAGHGSGEILGHELRIDADRYTPADATLIPTGAIEPVADTPYDFRTPKKIGKDIDRVELGYDINFVVNGEPGTLRPAARAREPVSGRVLELHTTEPGVQLYTANKLGLRKGKGGAEYGRYAGFCLETQHYPDSVNKPHWPTVVLRPGRTYRHVMAHRFTVE